MQLRSHDGPARPHGRIRPHGPGLVRRRRGSTRALEATLPSAHDANHRRWSGTPGPNSSVTVGPIYLDTATAWNTALFEAKKLSWYCAHSLKVKHSSLRAASGRNSSQLPLSCRADGRSPNLSMARPGGATPTIQARTRSCS
jgi:hypothetical protein